MKKTLLFLASLLMTMGAFADKVTLDFTGQSAYGMTLLSGNTNAYNDDPYVCKEGNVTLTLNGKTRWWKLDEGNILRFYKGSSMNIAVPEGSVVTSVELDTKNTGSFETSVGTYADGTWTGSANTVDIACNIAKSNAGVSKITVTYKASDAPEKKAPGLEFSVKEATATLGAEFTAPSLTQATTAAITYSSSDEKVATVDAATGAVTVLALGTTEITATAAENDEYAAGSAKYTLTVIPPVLDVVSEPYFEPFESGLGSFTIDDASLGEGLSYVWKIDTSYKCAKASAYVNKTNIASESWIVSPWIQVASSASNLYFDHAISKYFGTVADEATVWIKAEGGDWTQLTVNYPAIADGKSFSAFETQTVSLASYAGQKVKVGFKYVSTSSAAGTWEVKNFMVCADATGINEVKTAVLDENAPVYNLAGQRVSKEAKGILIQNGKKFVR